MHRSVTTRCCRLALRLASALALTIAPYQIALHGSTPVIHAASAQAKGGNNGNGGGGGNGGNSGGGNSGNSGGGNSGNSSGGNSGNSNGSSGSSNSSNSSNSGNNGNGKGKGNSGNAGKSGSNKGKNNNSASHVNVATGDKVDVTGNKITVRHPDGITEELENGRFRMGDALGRTIIDRRATPADISRLKAL